MSQRTLTRRLFLRGSGGVTLALPFLPSLFSRELRAQAAGRPKRFIAFKSHSGEIIEAFFPSRTGSGGGLMYQTATAVPGMFSTRPYGLSSAGVGDPSNRGQVEDGTLICPNTLSESSGRHPDSGREYFGSYANLTDFASTGFSDVIGNPGAELLSKMLVFRGLDFMYENNHSYAGPLGNFSRCLAARNNDLHVAQENPTVDQVLARNLKVQPASMGTLNVLPGLEGPETDDISYTYTTRNGYNWNGIAPTVVRETPLRAFQALGFVAQPGSGDSAPVVNPNMEHLNAVYDDYRRVRDRLGQADRDVLENHMTLVNNLLSDSGGGTPQPSADCPSTLNIDFDGSADSVRSIETAYAQLVDVIEAAIKCDLTRIVTVNLQASVGDVGGGSMQHFVHTGGNRNADPNTSRWHELAHIPWGASRNARVRRAALARWHFDNVFYEVARRLNVPEEGGDGATYLDNTIMMYANEVGWNHVNQSVPVVLAGSGGGYLETGKFIDYIDRDVGGRFGQHNGTAHEGIPYNRLLNTIAQAFGLTPEEYENAPGQGFGDSRPRNRVNEVKRPGGAAAYDYDLSTVGMTLPGVVA